MATEYRTVEHHLEIRYEDDIELPHLTHIVSCACQ